MSSYEICEIFRNAYFKEQLRKIASICFTSKYYKNWWWWVWTRQDLDSVQSIFLNVTTLFNQMQPYNLYVS